MQQFNFPTKIFFGEGSLDHFCSILPGVSPGKIMVVTDATLVRLGLAARVTDLLARNNIEYAVFDKTHPNPIEEDILEGKRFFKKNRCKGLLALGGGSPIDAAKVIKIAVAHSGPLEEFEESVGGDERIQNQMPPLFAVPTTAGTGSEVGRSGVIIMKKTGIKTIFFHPDLIPEIAILEPSLTFDLPGHITAATGIDALTHSLEAYFSPEFHPMAEGIAFEAIKLIVQFLPKAYNNGKDSEARGKMLLAATMGATAFQKGLGMTHSLAHPLSARHGLHHGLAISLLLPFTLEFIEQKKLNKDQQRKILDVHTLFIENGFSGVTLAESSKLFLRTLGIQTGLMLHKITEKYLKILSREAFQDGCHKTNIIPVNQADLLAVYTNAL